MTSLGLLIGWIADLLWGDPRRAHPVALYGGGAAATERLLWRDHHASGVVYVAALVGAPAAATWRLHQRLDAPWLRAAVSGALTWTALGGRSLRREADAIATALDARDLDAARRRLPALVGRDPSTLNEAEICRAVVESVAENTGDAIVAPVVWGALAGPAGVVAHRCANTLDAMVGHRSPRYQRFGWAAARLDDALNWLPARIGVAATALAAGGLGMRPGAAVRTARRDGGRHPSPNAGRLEAAFAGALGVRLGGVNRYGDRTELRGPLGEGPPPDASDIRRAVELSAAVGAVTVAGALAAGAGCAAVAKRWRRR